MTTSNDTSSNKITKRDLKIGIFPFAYDGVLLELRAPAAHGILLLHASHHSSRV